MRSDHPQFARARAARPPAAQAEKHRVPCPEFLPRCSFRLRASLLDCEGP